MSCFVGTFAWWSEVSLLLPKNSKIVLARVLRKFATGVKIIVNIIITGVILWLVTLVLGVVE
jgi:hypothetical protein